MYFVLLMVVILTAIGLVAIALGVARAISPVRTTRRKARRTSAAFPRAASRGCSSSRVLPLCDPVPDVRRRTVFLFAWAVVVQEIGVFGLVSALFFLLILTFGLAYAWRKGALEWK